MGRIRALSDSVIGKIAAGEVVERPAAAVKELVENSIDAGSTSVTVEIRDEATDYIRVTDNGSGIAPEDLRLAFERHATSKIQTEKDLFSVSTMGFRGEALASIAAVARVTMTTRTAGGATGLKVTNNGGRFGEIEETAASQGTTIILRDLFFNAPVRKNFLRRPSAEISAITDVMARFILSRPDISFRYISGGRSVYNSPGDGQLSSAVISVFGTQAFRQMRKIAGNGSGMTLSGYVGAGELARSTRNAELFFINDRMMRSTELSAAVENGCRERVMIGRYPMCILHIKTAYDAVDVNVHPNKLEVRFRDTASICAAVTSAVQECLAERDALEKPVEMKLEKESETDLPPVRTGLLRQREDNYPENSIKKPAVILDSRLPSSAEFSAPAEKPAPVFREIADKKLSLPAELQPDIGPEAVSAVDWPRSDTGAEPVQSAVYNSGKEAAPAFYTGGADTSTAHKEKTEQLSAPLPELRERMKIFGAVFNTFILIEYADQLLMVDQHAVHERLLFDRMMAEFDQPGLGQELLVPVIISVTAAEMKLLEENSSLLKGIGMIIEPFGETDMAVRTMPVILGETQAPDLIREILGELESGRTLTFEKKRTAVLQSACKHAVKGGEELTEDQLRSLVEEMVEKKVTPTCPHGRPLVVSISHRELDKKFKRIQ